MKVQPMLLHCLALISVLYITLIMKLHQIDSLGHTKINRQHILYNKIFIFAAGKLSAPYRGA